MTKFIITEEELLDLYIKQNLSTRDIGKMYQVDNKTVRSRLKKYGIHKEPTKEQECRKQKYIQTCLEKYGVSNTSKDKEIKSKASKALKNSIRVKYGVDNISQVPEVKNKVKDTCIRKYGTTCSLLNKEVDAKARQTNLKRYGTEYPSQSLQVRQKVENTCLQKYGTKSPMENDAVKAKAQKTNLRKYGVGNVFQNEFIKERIQKTVQEKYGVPYYCLTNDCKKLNKNLISRRNIYFKTILENLGQNISLEYRIGTKSYDLHIENTKYLIEINPTISHNSLINVYSKKAPAKDKNYHYQKSKLATENGYHCIHIWDWDDIIKISNVFQKKQKIYARSTKVQYISEQEANKFNNLYHLQNTCRGQKVCLGLFHGTELVSLMSFGKPRYNKNYQWELLRYTTHPEYMILGGAEKLFKHFIEDYDVESMITYCDYSKFTGDVYKKLDFKYIRRNSPSCHWIKGNKRITQSQLSKYGFDKLLGDIYGKYGKGLNNQELMINHGFLPIYDCGQLVFEWRH